METPTVPSRHFEIAPEPGGAQVVDRQSTNGTAAIGAYLAMRRVLMGSKAALWGKANGSRRSYWRGALGIGQSLIPLPPQLQPQRASRQPAVLPTRRSTPPGDAVVGQEDAGFEGMLAPMYQAAAHPTQPPVAIETVVTSPCPSPSSFDGSWSSKIRSTFLALVGLDAIFASNLLIIGFFGAKNPQNEHGICYGKEEW